MRPVGHEVRPGERRGRTRRSPSVAVIRSLFFLGALAAGAARADPLVYVAAGSTWRYFPGTADPSSPDPAAWRRRDFDDSSWRSGGAPFGILYAERSIPALIASKHIAHVLHQPSGENRRICMLTRSELQRIQIMIHKQLQVIGGMIALTHMVLDGHFGNHPAVHMVRGCGLHLMSKLRHDAALYFPYDGPYAGRGPRRKYGDKLDYHNIPVQYLTQTTVEDNLHTRIYQGQLLHKEFAQPLHVVILVKTNLTTQACAYVVLLSSDLDLSDVQLIDKYSLRFQIEFNFRDTKQYWGLEDFMHVQETAVSNAANFSLFMVNVAHVLGGHFRNGNPHFGVLDLKAYFRGHKYVAETLKLLPQSPVVSL